MKTEEKTFNKGGREGNICEGRRVGTCPFTMACYVYVNPAMPIYGIGVEISQALDFLQINITIQIKEINHFLFYFKDSLQVYKPQRNHQMTLRKDVMTQTKRQTPFICKFKDKIRMYLTSRQQTGYVYRLPLLVFLFFPII